MKTLSGREHHAELRHRRTQVTGGQESRQHHESIRMPGSQDLRFIHHRTLHQQPPPPHPHFRAEQATAVYRGR